MPIREDFEAYVPPRWFRRTVERLLKPLDVGHTNGLEAIVLTDSARFLRRGGRASRRQKNGTPIGRYHPAFRGQRAWIELIVDRIIGQLPKPWWYVGFVREMAVAQVLYHEIGHHLHYSVGSAARGGEPSAEAWNKRLTHLYFRPRFWYMRPFGKVMAPVAKWFDARRHRRRQSDDTAHNRRSPVGQPRKGNV